MSLQPVIARRSRRRRSPLAVTVSLALVVAACGGGAAPSSDPVEATSSPGPDVSTDDPIPSPTAAATRSAPTTPGPAGTPPGSPATSPGPTPAAIPAEPPVARLLPRAGVPVEGALGGYTWGDHGSDAPWIVVPTADAVAGGGPYTVTFDPPVPPGPWTAAWAPIQDGTPGAIAGHEQGTGKIAFAGPDAGGPWTLKLDVEVPGVGRATWFWRLPTEP